MCEELTGSPLECTVFGKPHTVTYKFVTETLEAMAQEQLTLTLTLTLIGGHGAGAGP